MTAVFLEQTLSVEELAARIQSLVGERQALRACAATRETLESNRQEICRLQHELSLALIDRFQPAA
jgi:DNA-binding response OmpR family regulator